MAIPTGEDHHMIEVARRDGTEEPFDPSCTAVPSTGVAAPPLGTAAGEPGVPAEERDARRYHE